MSAAPKANPPIRTLLGPGPSPVSPRVLAALCRCRWSAISILSFWKSWIRAWRCCASCFRPRTALALPMSGTGSAGMETCFVNLIEPGERVLIGVNGVFGTRMVDVAQRCGAQVDTVDAEWGTRARRPEIQRRAGEKQI